MGQPGDMYLNGIKLSPYGRTFRVNPLEEARAERTVNGRLIKDILYRKQEFSLSYEIITGDAINTFTSLYDLQEELTFMWVDSDGTENSYTVHMGPFDRTRLVLIDDGLWTGAEIELREA